LKSSRDARRLSQTLSSLPFNLSTFPFAMTQWAAFLTFVIRLPSLEAIFPVNWSRSKSCCWAPCSFSQTCWRRCSGSFLCFDSASLDSTALVRSLASERSLRRESSCSGAARKILAVLTVRLTVLSSAYKLWTVSTTYEFTALPPEPRALFACLHALRNRQEDSVPA
jgi:hypothetical protein